MIHLIKFADLRHPFFIDNFSFRKDNSNLHICFLRDSLFLIHVLLQNITQHLLNILEKLLLTNEVFCRSSRIDLVSIKTCSVKTFNFYDRYFIWSVTVICGHFIFLSYGRTGYRENLSERENILHYCTFLSRVVNTPF